jgi:hypothetical protein
MRNTVFMVLSVAMLGLATGAHAQESGDFYETHVAAAGNLEIIGEVAGGVPEAAALPLYTEPVGGVNYAWTNWWNTTFEYTTVHDWNGTRSNEWNVENVLRVLRQPRRVNPLVVFLYEGVNSFVREQRVGYPAETLHENERVAAGELAVGEGVRRWSLQEVFVAVKDVSRSDPFASANTFNAARPLSSEGFSTACRLCRRNLVVGGYKSGGLGTTNSFGFANTAQSLAPLLGWRINQTNAITATAGVGLTPQSYRLVLTVSYLHNVPQFSRIMRGWLTSKR